MTLWTALGVNLLGISLLAYATYFRRYYRRDLLLAYVALNVGVFAVTVLLLGASVSAGLGLGLFGVLSIIRLRSDAITQEEVAYYFIALAMGLVNGLQPAQAWIAPALTGLLVVVMWAIDHPRLTARTQRQIVTLDRAYTDRVQLTAALEQLLGGRVRHLVICDTDLVRDLTVVDVRFRVEPAQGAAVTTPLATARSAA